MLREGTSTLKTPPLRTIYFNTGKAQNTVKSDANHPPHLQTDHYFLEHSNHLMGRNGRQSKRSR